MLTLLALHCTGKGDFDDIIDKEPHNCTFHVNAQHVYLLFFDEWIEVPQHLNS